MEYRGPKGIADALGVSARTVRRRILEYGLDEARPPAFTMQDNHRIYSRPVSRCTPITDITLDSVLHDALEIFPNFGTRMLKGYLKTLNYNIPWERISSSLERINGAPGVFGPRRLHRRVYQVPGPNALWHGDANLGPYNCNISYMTG